MEMTVRCAEPVPSEQEPGVADGGDAGEPEAADGCGETSSKVNQTSGAGAAATMGHVFVAVGFASPVDSMSPPVLVVVPLHQSQHIPYAGRTAILKMNYLASVPSMAPLSHHLLCCLW